MILEIILDVRRNLCVKSKIKQNWYIMFDKDTIN